MSIRTESRVPRTTCLCPRSCSGSRNGIQYKIQITLITSVTRICGNLFKEGYSYCSIACARSVDFSPSEDICSISGDCYFCPRIMIIWAECCGTRTAYPCPCSCSGTWNGIELKFKSAVITASARVGPWLLVEIYSDTRTDRAGTICNCPCKNFCTVFRNCNRGGRAAGIG